MKYLSEFEIGLAGSLVDPLQYQLQHFGEIWDKQMILNKAGRYLQQQLKTIGKNRPQIKLDAFVIMPDHFHCIIFIVDNKFFYPIDYQNYKQNVFDVNGVDTIHELYLRGLHQSKTFSKNHHFDKMNNDEKNRKYKKIPTFTPSK